MASLADDRPKVPKPPRLSHLIACAIEWAIVVAFIANRSSVGLLLCCCYTYFSATRALFLPDEE